MSEIDIHALTPERIGDFLKFFDGEAFADNPAWRHCYCNFLYHPHAARPWKSTTAEENRTATSQRICARGLNGYLAFEGKNPIGWCQAGPRSAIAALADAPDPGAQAATAGSIVCFVIAKRMRRQGIARRFLAVACDGFRDQGLQIAEAYPRPDSKTDGENHYGPLSLYLAAGFTPVANDPDGAIVVRKTL
jgi:GNAT superfamily N-acetyltransferase